VEVGVGGKGVLVVGMMLSLGMVSGAEGATEFTEQAVRITTRKRIIDFFIARRY
jgi:hypothetical protein